MAIKTWKRLAGAMEAHLAFRGIDIGDWHRGTMSSRRLLVLCEHIPELGGRWPLALRVSKEIHKEAAMHRASLYVGGPHEYRPKLFLDPAEALELVEATQAEDEFMEEATDELYGSVGFT